MSRFLNEQTKKLLIILGGIITFFVVILIVVSIVGKVKTTKKTFPEIEDIMAVAAEKYYTQNKDLLPINNNETTEVDANTLVQKKLMKAIEKYQKNKNAICSGRVIVTKSGDNYDYSPFLDCGDTYTTKYLYSELIGKVVTNGDGLYTTNQYYNGKYRKTYIYRGEYPNNYISLNNYLWRILKVNDDRTITLILDKYNRDYIDSDTFWDNRYNIESKGYDGINIYEKSRIIKNMDELLNKKLFNKNILGKLSYRKQCVGSRKNTDNVNDGSIECREMSSYTKAIWLPLGIDYINASLDSLCFKFKDSSCTNYNYLTKYGTSWWLITTSDENTYTGYFVSGKISDTKLSNRHGIRPIITLNENTIYVNGDGSKTNPFTIK